MNRKMINMLFIISLLLTICPVMGEGVTRTVTDIDGNAYHTAKIGSQVWMTENLRVTHYRDGSEIPNISDATLWHAQKTGAFCWYENDPKFKNQYGALYNFYVVADSRGLCPAGWHVPSALEFRELQEYSGGSDSAGDALKETGTRHWRSPNSSATNISGFTALPAGGRGAKGEFGEMGNYATWWSSTSDEATYAWHWGLKPDSPQTRGNPGHKASGFSVRCIKD